MEAVVEDRNLDMRKQNYLKQNKLCITAVKLQRFRYNLTDSFFIKKLY